ncbi:hypothetical protein NDA17_000084 [Ustilago hordei]|nr:hypothetical protein NDA17_000084 [Ustilago hordei]
MSSNATLSTPNNGAQIKASRTRGASHIDFKSATTGVAAKAMRNELNGLVAGIDDPAVRKAFEAEMSNFF